MPWCCCRWGWCSMQGPARNSSLLSTKGGAQLGCFFSSSILTPPINGISYLVQGLGLFQSYWSLQYVFIWNYVLLFIQKANFLSAYIWDSVLDWSKVWCCYSKGLWVLDARILYWDQVSPGQRELAHCLPPVATHVGALIQDEEVWLFFSFFKHVLDFSLTTS